MRTLEGEDRERRLESLWRWRAAVIPEKSDAARPGYAAYRCLVDVEGLDEIVMAELQISGRYQVATLVIKTENPEDFLSSMSSGDFLLDTNFMESHRLELGMRWRWGPLSFKESEEFKQVKISRLPTRIETIERPRSLIAADFAGALERLTNGQVEVMPYF